MLMIFAAFAGAITTTAAPINFSEVSLWVRARETDQSIVREVSQRKLVRALTSQQEATLKKLKLRVKDAMERHIAQRLQHPAPR